MGAPGSCGGLQVAPHVRWLRPCRCTRCRTGSRTRARPQSATRRSSRPATSGGGTATSSTSSSAGSRSLSACRRAASAVRHQEPAQALDCCRRCHMNLGSQARGDGCRQGCAPCWWRSRRRPGRTQKPPAPSPRRLPNAMAARGSTSGCACCRCRAGTHAAQPLTRPRVCSGWWQRTGRSLQAWRRTGSTSSPPWLSCRRRTCACRTRARCAPPCVLAAVLHPAAAKLTCHVSGAGGHARHAQVLHMWRQDRPGGTRTGVAAGQARAALGGCGPAGGGGLPGERGWGQPPRPCGAPRAGRQAAGAAGRQPAQPLRGHSCREPATTLPCSQCARAARHWHLLLCCRLGQGTGVKLVRTRPPNQC